MALYSLFFRPLWDLFYCILSTLGSFISFLTGRGNTIRTSTHYYLLTTLNQKVLTLYECLYQCSSMCNDQAQLIRLKRIYNFFLFYACFGDIAICFDALSYHLQLIWTNLLTQCPGPISVYFRPCITDKGEK